MSSCRIAVPGPVAPHVVGFTQFLEEQGYAPYTVGERVRAAEHLGRWMERNDLKLEDLAETETIDSFGRHFAKCRSTIQSRACKRPKAGAHLFVEYGRSVGVIAAAAQQAQDPQLFDSFRRWMFEHRGVKAATLEDYGRTLKVLVATLGDDPARFRTSALREFVVEHGRPHGRGQAQNIATAVRVFLRYLVATDQCPVALENAIPPVASWRLAALPKYLVPADVEKLLGTCKLGTAKGLRDRAILLLLCRLGLRAKEVMELRFDDIDWKDASFVVLGKGGRRDRLPLPQEVGDAILAYLERGRPRFNGEQLFLRARPPRRGFLDSTAVSGIVRQAIHRAKVIAPSHGAHVLRHSAATQMLRGGSSLEAIAKVLRHSSVEMTAHYAKIDVALLKDVAQPWPEVASC